MKIIIALPFLVVLPMSVVIAAIWADLGSCVGIDYTIGGVTCLKGYEK